MKKQPLKIWLLKISEELPIHPGANQSRTYFLADELRRRGHQVTWWASAFDHRTKSWTFPEDQIFTASNGVIVRALKGASYKSNVSLRRLLDHRIISWKFARQSRRVPSENQPDLILTSIPAYDLSYQAVRYAKSIGIPAVVDIRDYWPDQFLLAAPQPIRPVLRAALFHDFRMAYSALRKADSLVSMSESVLHWGINRAGRKRSHWDQVFHLGFPKASTQPSTGRESPKVRELVESCRDHLKVTYVGTFGMANSPNALIQAAELLKAEPIKFILAGTGMNLAALQKTAQHLPNVIFPGWLNTDEVTQLLSASDIGVSTFWEALPSFPNKLFRYLAAGVPVLSSSTGEVRKIIEDLEVGYNFENTDYGALAELIQKLNGDSALRKKMAANSLNAFEKNFSVEVVYSRFADMLEALAKSR